MGAPRIGSLFSGYGGLEQGVQAVYGGSTAWVSDIDKGACKILAHRYPDVPNLGDITTVDWAQVEPVDILTGGSPCQDLSHAGKRSGMTEGARSNLWVAMREAIAQLRPSLVIWENVRGAYSAAADSDVEPCPGCVGDGPGVHLRALGRVLGDLSDLGYDASWHGLRAADIGAPHGRFRVFVVAHAVGGGLDGWTPQPIGRPIIGVAAPRGGEDARLLPTPTSSDTNGPGAHGNGGVDLRTAISLLPTPRATRGGSNTETAALLPTPRATDGDKGSRTLDGAQREIERGKNLDLGMVGALLPTPAVNDMGEGKTVEAWDEWTATMQAKHGNGNGHGKSLAIEAQRLLPTPQVQDAKGHTPDNRENRAEQGRQLQLGHVVGGQDWGIYAAAITRWETLTRPAPAPTQPSKKGTPQLSAAFSEWLMGLPAGWVTDVPGITRNEALKALGNGVVPKQAEAAIRYLLTATEVAA